MGRRGTSCFRVVPRGRSLESEAPPGARAVPGARGCITHAALCPRRQCARGPGPVSDGGRGVSGARPPCAPAKATAPTMPPPLRPLPIGPSGAGRSLSIATPSRVTVPPRPQADLHPSSALLPTPERSPAAQCNESARTFFQKAIPTWRLLPPPLGTANMWRWHTDRGSDGIVVWRPRPHTSGGSICEVNPREWGGGGLIVESVRMGPSNTENEPAWRLTHEGRQPSGRLAPPAPAARGAVHRPFLLGVCPPVWYGTAEASQDKRPTAIWAPRPGA